MVSDGRVTAGEPQLRLRSVRGKSGLHGKTVPVNGRRGQPQGQRHRNDTAYRPKAAARLKWCGKSAPRLWQQRRLGKPHREQDQIGTARWFFRPVVRVGRVRCGVTHIPEEWSPPRKWYRTRLTGHLMLFSSPICGNSGRLRQHFVAASSPAVASLAGKKAGGCCLSRRGVRRSWLG